MDWQGIEIELQRKPVRNLNLVVYPDGRVRLSVPARVPEREIRRFMADREDWIRFQLKKFGSQPSSREPNLLSGDRIPVWGQERELVVAQGPGTGQVEWDGSRLRMTAPPDSQPDDRRRVLIEWYRAELRRLAPPVFARWQPAVGAYAAEWRVRDMHTRWGSCSIRARRVWLNVRLAAWPPECLELVVIHELTHLLVPDHSARFYTRLENVLPDWRERQSRLNAPPAGLTPIPV